jgi:L-threonylcarbamoyladenylate synthase
VPVRIEKIDSINPDPRLIERAVNFIRKGKVIVCPTDTGYAFTANALDVPALHRVFILKGRAYSNPIHVAVHSMKAAAKYAHINKIAEALAGRYLPGALTLVLPKKEIVPSLLVAGRDTVGIRIPDNRVMLKLAELADLPLTATSANLSGKPGTYSVPEIIDQMGDDFDAALILDQGELPVHEVSTLVDLSVSPPQLVRQGKISWLEIFQFIQSLPAAG